MIKGFITQEKFLLGRSLPEIELILGFRSGHFERGARVVALEQIPHVDQFDLAGYSQVAGHRLADQYGKIPLDRQKLKEFLVAHVFTTVGSNRLVKVLAMHDIQTSLKNNEQYPSGEGAPQWILLSEIPGRIVAEISYPEGRYIPNT